MIAALFMRALDTRGNAYLPFFFVGDWTEQEKGIVAAAIAPNVPERVDAGFNNFDFYKFGADQFCAKRFTWDTMGMNSRTAAELAEKLTEYYQG